MSLFTLFLAACGGVAPTGAVGGALVGPPPDGGGSCVLGQTVCNAARTALSTCTPGVDNLGIPYNTWQGSSCPTNEVCVSSQSSDGLQHDFCAECNPGASYCKAGVLQVCGSDGHIHFGGPCANHCDCGGTYPHCRLCQ